MHAECVHGLRAGKFSIGLVVSGGDGLAMARLHGTRSTVSVSACLWKRRCSFPGSVLPGSVLPGLPVAQRFWARQQQSLRVSDRAASPTMPRAETPASVPAGHTPALLEAALASCVQKRPAPASVGVVDVRTRRLVPFFPAGQAHPGTVNQADNIKGRYWIMDYASQVSLA